MVDMKLIDNSVYRLLMEKFELGLFENPYVDIDYATRMVGSSLLQEKADLAMRKSIVLLRNENNFLPIGSKTKVYFETYFQKRGEKSASTVIDASKLSSNVQLVHSPEEAYIILVWITPGSKSLFDADGSPLFLSLSKNAVDIKYINQLTAKKPTVLAINYTNPWVIDEIYNEQSKGNVKAVIATFGTKPEALLDIVSGKFNPTGKMPFTTPISEEQAQKQLSDVPGYMKGKQYGLFWYDEGLSYKK